MPSKNVRFGESITFLFVDQKSPIFSPNVEGVVIDKILFPFAICRIVDAFGEIAIKVESCQKSRRILDVFSPFQILGAGLPNVIPILSRIPHGTSPGKSFEKILPLISPEAIVAHMLNVKPNFKFSRLSFLMDPIPVRVCTSNKQGLVNL